MGYSGMVSDSGSEIMAGVRRIGGLSASMYRLTVSRCIPNSLSMPRIDRPFRLASCTAFHLSLCRKVGLPAGMEIVIFSGASSIASSSHSWDSSGIRLGFVWDLAQRFGHRSQWRRRASGAWGWDTGDSRARLAVAEFSGLDGASWEAMIRPSCCSDSRPSSPARTVTVAPA